MTTAWIDATDDELGALLIDLGVHLEEGADAVAPVTERIRDGGAARPAARRRVPRWLVAAALVIVAVSTILAVAPAREAVARWLGIGAVEIRTGTPHSDVAPSSTVPAGEVDVAGLRAQLPFDVRLLDPDLAGEPLGAAVDPGVPAGLVEIRYADVSLIEIASEPGDSPALGKIVGDGTSVETVSVGANQGFWLTGRPHEIGYLDPGGSFRTDSLRRAGNVLMWADDGVTYRIEGSSDLGTSLELAESLR